MQTKILKLLKDAKGNAVSGEDIASELGVSRSAVWKRIKELKNLGYEIESLSRNGYTLKSVPDLLLPYEVDDGLKTKFIGKNIVYFDEIGSTNNEAKKLAAEGAADGTIVVAEEQGTGKGRLSRSWFSPRAKGIWFSTILRPSFLPQDAPKCTLLAAVSIVKAAQKFGVNVGIKWPNDILFEGKKLVGTLTEMSAEMERINYVVIGTGINVNLMPEDFPPDVKDIATSLAIVKGEKISRVELFRAILEETEMLYEGVIQNGFAPLLDEWRKYSVTLGQEVNIIGVGENDDFSGKAVDIDDDGALLIETEGKIRKVFAGDVSIRPRRK